MENSKSYLSSLLKKKYKYYYVVIVSLFLPSCIVSSQNMAVNSGNWNDCSTWGNPEAIFRNTSDTKTINNGIIVTANENWSTGILQMNTYAVLNLNSSVQIDFVNDQGNDKLCNPLPYTGAPYLCHSQRNFVFTTVNGYNVTPTVTGTIFSFSSENFGINNMCGSPVCTNNDVTSNYMNATLEGSEIVITFSRPVTNVRLLISSFSDFENFTITTNGGNPTLTSCYGEPTISGNLIHGPSNTPSNVDVNIGGVWYTSIRLFSTTASVYIGYGFGNASAQ